MAKGEWWRRSGGGLLLPLLNAGGGSACHLPWVTVMHCHGVGNLAAITIATNEPVHPSPRLSLDVQILAAGPPATWQLELLIQGKLDHMLVASLGNPEGTRGCCRTLVEKNESKLHLTCTHTTGNLDRNQLTYQHVFGLWEVNKI